MIRVRIQLSVILGRKRWTQAKLAKKARIRPNTINEWYWEIAERINLNHLARICEILDCDIDDILILERIDGEDIDDESIRRHKTRS